MHCEWHNSIGYCGRQQGFLLPLCASGTCTLREAVIVSSVLRRVSLPVLHSAAALARLASMAYSGVNSFFIRVRTCSDMSRVVMARLNSVQGYFLQACWMGTSLFKCTHALVHWGAVEVPCV